MSTKRPCYKNLFSDVLNIIIIHSVLYLENYKVNQIRCCISKNVKNVFDEVYSSYTSHVRCKKCGKAIGIYNKEEVSVFATYSYGIKMTHEFNDTNIVRYYYLNNYEIIDLSCSRLCSKISLFKNSYTKKYQVKTRDLITLMFFNGEKKECDDIMTRVDKIINEKELFMYGDNRTISRVLGFEVYGFEDQSRYNTIYTKLKCLFHYINISECIRIVLGKMKNINLIDHFTFSGNGNIISFRFHGHNFGITVYDDIYNHGSIFFYMDGQVEYLSVLDHFVYGDLSNYPADVFDDFHFEYFNL